MTRKNYECRSCGRLFSVEDGKEPRCPHCSSKEVGLQPDRQAPVRSCGVKGRFS